MSDALLLTRREVAALFGFRDPHATDRLVRKHASFPRPCRAFSRSPRWLRRDVVAWMRRHAKAAQFHEVQMERAS